MASFDSPEDRRNYIMQGAQQRGLDQKLIDRLVRSEGGYSTFDKTGDSGRSFGPFQDYTGGGLGNTMRAQGLEPSDPRLETQNIDWNLNYIQEHGASPDVWHGLRRSGSGGSGGEKLQPEGYYDSSLHVNVRPTDDNNLSQVGALFLSGLLKNAYPEEAKQPTGNALLDGLIKASMPGNEPTPAQQHPRQEFIEPPAAPLPPATVPELQPQGLPPATPQPQPQPQVPTAPMPTPPASPMPMQAAAAPAAPATPATPAPQPSLNPLNLLINQAHAETPGARAAPAPQPAQPPAPAPPPGNTGNGLLDTLLKRASLLPFAGPAIGAARVLAQPPETEQGPGDLMAADPFAESRRAFAQNQGPPINPTDPRSLARAALNLEQGPGFDVALSFTGGGEGPKGGLPRGVPERIEPTFGRAPVPAPAAAGGGRAPPAQPPSGGGGQATPPATLPPPKGVTDEALSDDLFRSQQTSEAEKLEAQKLVEALAKKGVTPADSQAAYHVRESRMTKRPAQQAGVTKFIEETLKPLDDKALADAQWIYEHAPDVYKTMPEAPLRTAEEGHVHRKVVGKQRPGERLDPSEGDVLTRTFLRGGGLSKRASGLMHRDPDYLWENNAGDTLPKWGKLKADKQSAQEYGQTFTDQNGVKWTARQPTTRELEQHFPNRKYIDDLVANTIDNALRLGRVRRNIEILEKWKPRLLDEGLWYPEGSQSPDIPRNFDPIEVPQLRGVADPMVASIINDIYRSSGNNWSKVGDQINKVIIGSMFWLPIRHQLNVAAHYTVGRGFDWLYRNPQLTRAATEVATLGPNYIRYLKEGAGLRYASTQNENFYNTLLTKMGHDIVNDPEWSGISKSLGFKTPLHLAEKVYKASRSSLWKINDVFLTARIMELEKAGKPIREAIKIAEDEIPNYRLPTNNRALRMLADSPFVAFGRYGYGRGHALVKTVQNLVGPKATGEERLRAIGQALILVLGGTAGYTIANHALQETQKQLKGAMGDKWGKRILGDKPLEGAEVGPFGVAREVARYGLSYMPKSVQEATVPIINEKIGKLVGLEPEAEDWSKLLASLITPSPVTDLAATGLGGGRNPFTGQQVVNPHGHLPAEAVQAMEYGGGLFNPLGVGIQMARKGVVPGIAPQFGLRQEYKPNPRAIKMQKRGAYRQEQRDPLQRGANELFK